MYCCSPKRKPVGVAVLERVVRAMDIILHIGAHRTGTTSYQNYMRRAGDELLARGIAFWGPETTRKGSLSNIYPDRNGRHGEASRSPECGPLEAPLNAVRASGARCLIVSDENFMGSMRNNIRQMALYPQVGDRVVRVTQSFGSGISTILISPRSLENYWCSALAFCVKRGVPVPDLQTRAAITRSYRGWRDVIVEIANALPDVAIKVLPFEEYAGRADRFLSDAVEIDAPVCRERAPVNKSPGLPALRRAISDNGQDARALPLGMGRWNPFTNEQHSALREIYADDMMWLRSGADGLATLIEDGGRTNAGTNPPRAAKRKGQFDEFEERRMAPPG